MYVTSVYEGTTTKKGQDSRGETHVGCWGMGWDGMAAIVPFCDQLRLGLGSWRPAWDYVIEMKDIDVNDVISHTIPPCWCMLDFRGILQGDTARWFKTPVDTKTKVPFWPALTWPG